jgi:uncharacterized membrane protein
LGADLGLGRCIGINTRGQVVGFDSDGNTFVVDASGNRTPLPAPDANTLATGIGIDQNGRVAGYLTDSNGRRAAVFENNAWSPVPNLDAGEVMGVGPDGTLVGATNDSTSGLRGFVVSPAGTTDFDWPTELASAAYVANHGLIAGILETADGATHGFVSDHAALRDLGTLGGTKSAVYALDAAGDVVGSAEASDGVAHAFFVAAGSSTLVDLGLPGQGLTSDARGIDGSGDMVGNTTTANGLARAWLFRIGKDPVELTANDANGTAYLAVHVAAMSEDGRAVGWGLPPPTSAGNTLHCLSWSVGGL